MVKRCKENCPGVVVTRLPSPDVAMEEHPVRPRPVAVAIVYRLVDDEQDGKKHVDYLLVTSRKHNNRWVLPKGGIELDEIHHSGLAALREAWEEGGIEDGELVELVHTSLDPKPHRESRDVPRASYEFWLIRSKKESVFEWPEKSERQKKWVRRDLAIRSVEWRKDGQVDALRKVDENKISRCHS